MYVGVCLRERELKITLFQFCECVGERERERERKRDRKREREKERQTEREKERKREGKRERERQTDRVRDREKMRINFKRIFPSDLLTFSGLLVTMLK